MQGVQDHRISSFGLWVLAGGCGGLIRASYSATEHRAPTAYIVVYPKATVCYDSLLCYDILDGSGSRVAVVRDVDIRS